MSRRLTPLAVFALSLILFASTACRDDDPVTEPDVGVDDVGEDVADDDTGEHVEAHPFEAVDETESWSIPGLSAPVYVVRTEGNIPHIYAENDVDAARVHGFVAARDRYFMMDLARRLGLGDISSLLGDAGLETDIGARMTGSRHVAERIRDSAAPEILEVMEAFAEGINYYIEQAAAENVPYPSEVDLAWILLSLDGPADMLTPFTSLDVAGMLATFIYQTSFSGSPVGLTAAVNQLDTLYEGDRFEELRRAGVRRDIWESPHPIFELASGEWGPLANIPSTELGTFPGDHDLRQAPRVESGLLERLEASLEIHHERMGLRDDEKGFGSNAWAVSGAHTPDGASLMAADGHLALGIPSILYNVGLDTNVLTDGEGGSQLGLVIPGIPYIALGTNGQIAWAFTQLFGDVTDYYVEELQLDADGLPAATFFDGDWHDLEAIDEVYDVAGVPALQSQQRVETWTRWQTFDGRWLLDVEGTPVQPGAEVEPGQTVIRTHSGWVIPEDVDGDGTISAISFAYAGHQMDDLMGAFASFSQAETVMDFREGVRGMLASSFNFVASDAAGDIYYAAFQGTPCRSYLPRDAEGNWDEGADPRLLLDGTIYGAFIIPTANGVVDDSHRNDPYRCVVPFDESPQAYNPESGYVLTANHDPAGISFDRNLSSGPWYIGGPWYAGFRAETIDRNLANFIAEDRADIDAMAELQADVESPLGRTFVPYLLDALAIGEELSESMLPIVLDDWQERLLDDYTPRRDELLEVVERLEGWAERGYQARSGVDTFYNQTTQDDRDDAVATMIFMAYIRALMAQVFDDEAIPGVWQRGGSVGRVRLLYEMLEGRGAGNLKGLASFNEDTEESVFFDNRHTAELERSDELMVRAMVEALDFLEGESDGVGRGGFATTDMDQWLWGLRHQVVFESLLAGFLGNQPGLAALVADFAISTDRLPLAENLETGDPRRGLRWFPRDGDQYNVDASNAGITGGDFTYSSGPVMRMVVSLRDGEVTGQNVIPGGQSGLTDSEFFDDQAALWLGNDAYPMRFHLEDVIEGAIGLETYAP